MKEKKLSRLILSAIVIFGGAALYFGITSSEMNDEIRILGYKASEENSVNGYQIKKYENIESRSWIDNENILILKDNGKFKNPDADIKMSFLSKYNLNSMDMKDYSNMKMATREMQGVSPSGRYILYGEPSVIPKVESEQWKNAYEKQELFHDKRDILDLETGEIVEDFDKVVNNRSADYKWMSNDMIFVDYGGEWAILDRCGRRMKSGSFSFSNAAHNSTKLIDVNELDVTDGVIDGSFYYTKDFMGNDGNLGGGLYSMDVNTGVEKLIGKYERSMDYSKAGDIIAFEDFDNNGKAKDREYPDRTSGFKIINKQGELLQNISMPKGKVFSGLTLSSDGSKCVFIEGNDYINNKSKLDDGVTLDDIIKVLDVKTGEIKEITKVSDLFDDDKEERFRNVEVQNIDGNYKIKKGPGPYVSISGWNKVGDSLTFNYCYTSKEDGKNYTNTYVVTFDR